MSFKGGVRALAHAAPLVLAGVAAVSAASASYVVDTSRGQCGCDNGIPVVVVAAPLAVLCLLATWAAMVHRAEDCRRCTGLRDRFRGRPGRYRWAFALAHVPFLTVAGWVGAVGLTVAVWTDYLPPALVLDVVAAALLVCAVVSRARMVHRAMGCEHRDYVALVR